ncbi:MAG: cobalt transporter CbiM [Chloroflexota bacterium]
MHIPDGILPAAVAAGGYVVAGALTAYAMRQVNRSENAQEQIPKVALLTAAFFVASLIHIPIPPTSVHPLLAGLMGALLGWFSVPAIVIGLLLQALMFGHGGLTSLGVNAVIMAVPALVAHFVFQAGFNAKRSASWNAVFGFLAGGLGVGLTVLMFFGILISTISPNLIDPAAERAAIIGLTVAHIPLIIIEGLLTGMLVTYLNRVKPELLGGLITADARA